MAGFSDTLKIYSDDTKTALLGTYEASGGESISITSIASDTGISIPQNANGFYFSGKIYGLNDLMGFPGLGNTYNGYFTYPVPDTLKIYSDDTKTTLLGTYDVQETDISITSIASNAGISIPQNANGFYYNGAIYGLNDLMKFSMTGATYDGYFTYPVPSDTLKIYSDDTKTTLLGTYDVQETDISITSIASNAGISIPQNANGFYYNGAIYGLNDLMKFSMTRATYDGYFTYPGPTITGFYLDGTEYKFEGGGIKYNAGKGILINQENAISNTGVLSVNGQTGNVTIQTGGNYTAGNGINITNKKIGLNGTYEGTYKDYSAMQGPAPDGFHVPSFDEWNGVYNIMNKLSLTTQDGWRINLHIPIAGNRHMEDAKIKLQGSSAYLWTCTPNGEYAKCLIVSDDPSPFGKVIYSNGLSVRAFKNSYVSPNSSWTVVQGTLGSAGIFWNQSEGLISITNGTTGYTMMDKNLGATTVYNDGDTLAEANCGKYYQWGNNYGFGGIGGNNPTTSSTQVDASSYGPGNYYSSSTFIIRPKYPYNWDSSKNDNLWGGVTGIQTNTNSGNLVLGDRFYKIVTSTTAPASGTASNIITIVTD